MTIVRKGSFSISPLSDTHNNHVYGGIDNDVVLTRADTIEFTCEYNMGSYPFDTQKCSMIFVLLVSWELASNQVRH